MGDLGVSSVTSVDGCIIAEHCVHSSMLAALSPARQC